MRAADVLIVGAGPAGSSLAHRLSGHGIGVLLLDARRFPRSKPCGDALSPGATPLLDQLGAGDRLRRQGHRSLEGWRIRAPGGAWFEGRFSDRGTVPNRGLAIDRLQFDQALLEGAIDAGASFRGGRRVFAVHGADGASGGRPARGGDRRAEVRVEARDPDGRVRSYTARMVVGADGLRSRVARGLGPIRYGPRQRLALVARLDGVRAEGAFGQLRVTGDRILGYAPLGPDRCNVTLVVPAAQARAIGPEPEPFFRGAVAEHGAEPLIRGGQLTRNIEVTGPFEVSPTRTTGPGRLLVGDAFGYFDPFTGQGVFRALATARLATRSIRRALDHPAEEADALEEYDREVRSLIAPSRRVQRLVDAVISRPALFDPVARGLGRRPWLASRLMDVTGDRLGTLDALFGGMT